MSMLAGLAQLSPDQYRFVQMVKARLGWHASIELTMVLNGEARDFPTLSLDMQTAIRGWAAEYKLPI